MTPHHDSRMSLPAPNRKTVYNRQYWRQYHDPRKRANLSLTEREFAVFASLSRREGLSVPQMIKRLAFASVSQKPDIPREIAEIGRELIVLNRRIGNNINQIARSLNVETRKWGREYSPGDAAAVLRDIRTLLVQREEFWRKKLLRDE